MIDRLRIGRGIEIPLGEVELRASRSGGPGGQHANKTETRIEAVFEIEASSTLDATARRQLTARFGPRVVAVAQDSRSQTRNRELALKRLEGRIREGLSRQKRRRETKPGRGARERRLQRKRHTGQLKRQRRRPGPDD